MWGASFGSRGRKPEPELKATRDSFTHFEEIQIVAKLIERGVPREKLSTTYQNLWDKAQQWIVDGKPSGDDLPPGARWITDEMYEVDGELHFRDRKGYDKP